MTDPTKTHGKNGVPELPAYEPSNLQSQIRDLAELINVSMARSYEDGRRLGDMEAVHRIASQMQRRANAIRESSPGSIAIAELEQLAIDILEQSQKRNQNNVY